MKDSDAADAAANLDLITPGLFALTIALGRMGHSLEFLAGCLTAEQHVTDQL